MSVVLGTLYVIGASVASVASTTPVSTHASIKQLAGGKVKVTLTGTWAWKRATCDARTAVGFAVAWNDKQDAGLQVGSQRVGSPQDPVVHSNATAPCGATSGRYLAGYFGPLSHVYSAAADVPATLCPVSYALSGNRSPLVNAVRDNSVQRPTSAPTVACVPVSVPRQPVPAHHAATHHAAAKPPARPSTHPATAALVQGCHGGGPQIECNGSMEGNLGVTPGNDLFGGFHFELSDTSAPTTVTFVGAKVVYNYICKNSGATGSFDLPISPNSYVVPAGTHGDYPPGGQSDPAVNQGSMKAPDVCQGGQYQVNAQSGGGTFEALLQIDRPGVHLSHFQFHYGDHQGTSWSADAQWFPAQANYSCSAGTATSPTTATLTGTTTDASVDSAVFNLTPNNGNVTVAHNGGTWTGSATGLTPDTNYTYSVTFKSGGATVGTGSGAACSFHTPQQPTYSCSAATNVTTSTAVLHGETTDNTVDDAVFNLNHAGNVAVGHAGNNWTGTATGLTPDTDYTYTVTFKANGANKGTGSGAACAFHTPRNPTYSCTGASNIGINGADLGAATSDGTVDSVTFTLSPNGTVGNPAQNPAGTFTSHATNLTANQHYTYSVKFFDGANQVGSASGAGCAFDTNPAHYTCTAAQPLSPNSAIIGGSTSDGAVDGANAALRPVGGANTTVVLSGNNGSFSATATGLQPDTRYVYDVNFTRNGNLVHSSTNGGCSFTTPGIVTPTYKCDAPTFLSPTEAILAGETTDLAVHSATFSLNGGAPAAGTPSATNTGVFTYDQSGLAPGTNYSYTVNFGSVPAQSATCQFRTPSVSYTCLPTTHITTTSATLNASTTDNRVTDVNFALTPGGQTVAGSETSSGFYSGHATGLTPSTSYSYVATFLQNGLTLGSANCSFETPGNPPPAITIVVNKVNDANGNGTYTKDEQAPAPQADVPFQVSVTNTSDVPVILTDITDQWPGQSPFSVDCEQDFVGKVLAPHGQAGDSATCSFTLNGYAPNVAALVNTAIVHACQVDANGNPVRTNCEVLPSTSRVTVTQVLPFKTTKPPLSVLPFTGTPFGIAPTVLISVLLIGSGVLMLGWPQVVRASRRMRGAQA